MTRAGLARRISEDVRRVRSTARIAQLGVINVLIAGMICDRLAAALECAFDGRDDLATIYAIMASAGMMLLYTRVQRDLLRAQLRCVRAPEYTPAGANCPNSVEDVFDNGKRHWCRLPAHRGDVHECRCGTRWGADCLG